MVFVSYKGTDFTKIIIYLKSIDYKEYNFKKNGK